MESREQVAQAEKKERVQDQIQGYARNIMEEIATNWIPGLGMSAGALGLDETETDQLVVDMLGELRDSIQDYRREIGREAISEGRFVRFPT